MSYLLRAERSHFEVDEQARATREQTLPAFPPSAPPLCNFVTRQQGSWDLELISILLTQPIQGKAKAEVIY